jgi:2',3'-cyclic-nucleotide 2'-phosphodiesterase (5'-nucleotidase family)
MPAAVTVSLSRRLVLTGAAAAALAATLPARAAPPVGEALLLTLADLHSPYARLPAILSAVRAVRAEEQGRPAALILNGDIFERGNVAALRSGAEADWAFLRALAAELPVYVNLGNHETAIEDDMATTVARITGAGAQPLGNLIDRRTGRFFAPVSDRIGLGGLSLGLLALGTDNPFVYRQPARDTLVLPDPVGFARDAFAEVTGDTDLAVLVSHAGVSADKAIFAALETPMLALGAHDHLDFTHRAGGLSYAHGASWGSKLGVIGLTKGAQGVALDMTWREIAPGGGDPALADTIAAVKAAHLTAEDTAVIAERPVALDLPASILVAVEAVRAATGADLALLGHTTFGAPLAAGPLTQFDFDAFLRFDGTLAVAEVPGDRLAAILGRANQHLATGLDARTGDYVHAAALDIVPGRTYRLATNGWTAQNQKSYLGTEDLAFTEVPDLRLKAVVRDALAAG